MQYTRARFAGLIFLALTLVAYLCAQAPAQKPFSVPGTNGTWSVTGYVLTTSPVNVCSLTSSGSRQVAAPTCGETVFVCGGDVNAAAGTAATITITDALSGSFWTTVAPLSSTAASSYNIPFGSGANAPIGCRPFPKGLVVNASANTTITFSAWGVY